MARTCCQAEDVLDECCTLVQPILQDHATRRAAAAADALLLEEEAEKAARLRQHEHSRQKRKSKKKRHATRTEASGQPLSHASPAGNQLACAGAIEGGSVGRQPGMAEAAGAGCKVQASASRDSAADDQIPLAALQRLQNMQDAADSIRDFHDRNFCKAACKKQMLLVSKQQLP